MELVFNLLKSVYGIKLKRQPKNKTHTSNVVDYHRTRGFLFLST